MATATNKISIDDFLQTGSEDLHEILRALINMEKMLSSSSSERNESIKDALKHASSAIGKAIAEFGVELNKYVPTLEEEIAQMEKEDAKKKKPKTKKEPEELPETARRVLSPSEELARRTEETNKLHEERLKHKPVFSPVTQLKKKPIPGMGQKLESNMNIEMIMALADKLDAAGESEKAAQLDELLKRTAEELSSPEYQPEHSPGTPSWIEKDKWDKMNDVHELTESFKSFLDDPTMDKHSSLIDGIAKYMKHTKEEGVSVSSNNEVEKNASISDVPDSPLDHRNKEMMYDIEHSHEEEVALMEAFIKAIEEAKEAVGSAHAQGISMMGPQVQNTIKDLFTLSKHMKEQMRWDRLNSASPKAEVFEKLAGIADKLDSIGAVEEASMIDEFIEKQAKGKEKEQDPYDTKQHHSEQIREPKKPGKETKDRDGRKEHHVETYKDTGVSALSTRHCPEHVGVMLGRIGENTYQCALDGQVYNWETGWTDYDGKKHPGGSVAGQTPGASEYAIPHRIFDSREKI